jgi:predicted ATPase with chaperone activity
MVVVVKPGVQHQERDRAGEERVVVAIPLDVVAAHARLVEDYPTLSGQAESLLATALDSSLLTGRGVDRVRRVAASICALAGDGAVTEEHVAEAIGLRGEW